MPPNALIIESQSASSSAKEGDERPAPLGDDPQCRRGRGSATPSGLANTPATARPARSRAAAIPPLDKGADAFISPLPRLPLTLIFRSFEEGRRSTCGTPPPPPIAFLASFSRKAREPGAIHDLQRGRPPDVRLRPPAQDRLAHRRCQRTRGHPSREPRRHIRAKRQSPHVTANPAGTKTAIGCEMAGTVKRATVVDTDDLTPRSAKATHAAHDRNRCRHPESVRLKQVPQAADFQSNMVGWRRRTGCA